jgi:hypothetical protein
VGVWVCGIYGCVHIIGEGARGGREGGGGGERERKKKGGYIYTYLYIHGYTWTFMYAHTYIRGIHVRVSLSLYVCIYP